MAKAPAWTDLVPREWHGALNTATSGTTLRELVGNAALDLPPLITFPPLVPEPEAAEAAATPASAPPAATASITAMDEDGYRAIARASLSAPVGALQKRVWPRWGNPFEERLTPTRVVELGFTGYVERIGGEHMLRDLTGIAERARLKPGQAAKPPWPGAAPPRAYRSVDELDADLRTMVSNAEAYNGPKHEVTKMGRDLLAYWDRALRPQAEDAWRREALKERRAPT